MIQIFDINGRIVLSQQFLFSDGTIDVSFLTGGVYILRYVANKEVILKKILIL